MQRGLHAGAIHRCGGACRTLSAAVAIGEQQHRVAMHPPEAAQNLVSCLRQRDEAIPIAFGVADMHAPAYRINVADLKPQSLAQAQPQTVEGEVEHPVADDAGGCEQPLGLVDRDDVRQALAPGRLDQTGRDPGLAQDVRVVELQPVQVELDRTPGVRGHQIREVIGELCCGQRVNLIIKVVADAADGAGVRLDGLGLQAFKLEVLEMRLVLPLKVIGGGSLHAGLSSRNIAESIPQH